jgi:hypothetical protein
METVAVVLEMNTSMMDPAVEEGATVTWMKMATTEEKKTRISPLVLNQLVGGHAMSMNSFCKLLKNMER